MSNHAPADAMTPQPRAGTSGALGRYFSYFSHRIFIAYRPVDLHNYLLRLFSVVSEPDSADEYDAEVLRWALLHRARLNPLSLNRQVEALRGPNDKLLVPGGGAMGRSMAYRIDVTLQFACELALAEPDLAGWLDRRPRLRQPLIDAAYYVSHCWEVQDRIAQRSSAGSAQLDMSPSGQEAFKAYLLHRMNLYSNESVPADPKAARQWKRERLAIETSAISEQELDRLYAVAQSVARALAHADNPSVLRDEWDRLAAANPKGSLSVPSAALYGLLLIGKGKLEEFHVLVPTTPDDRDCMMFRWPYLPSGGGSQVTSFQMLADAAAPALKHIERLQSALSEALSELVAKDETYDYMHLLTKEYMVLRSPHPWSAIAATRDALSSRQGHRNLEALREQVQHVKEFGALLADPVAIEAVGRALVCAAALEGLADDTLPQAGVRPLRALADGLRFESCQLTDVLARVTRLQQRLSEFVAKPLTAPLAGEGLSGLKEKVSQARAAGIAKKGDAALLGDAAWKSVAARLRAPTSASSLPEPASLDEMICSVRAQGPGPWVELMPHRMTVHRWTRALGQALTPRSGTTPPTVPPWFAAYALERLGVCGIGPDAQQALLERLALPSQAKSELRRHIEEHQLWSGSGNDNRAALVLGPAGESLTDAWPLPPAGGLLLAATSKEALAMIGHGLDDVLQSTARVRLAWEPLSGHGAEDRELRTELNSRLGKQRHDEIWLYRAQAIGDGQPQAIDPATAQALWQEPGTR